MPCEQLTRRRFLKGGGCAVLTMTSLGFAPGAVVPIHAAAGSGSGPERTYPLPSADGVTIDRGALGPTTIGRGTKIDNLVQIAHNVNIGEHCLLVSQSGVAGSTRIGRHCAIGAAAQILGHLEIADHVQISSCTTISHSIRKPGTYTGLYPSSDNASWARYTAWVRHLDSLADRVRTLEKERKK